MKSLDQSIPGAIARLKAKYVKSTGEPTFLTEIVPVEFSAELPIESSILQSLHKFARANKMYVDSYHVSVGSVPCVVYKADINSYWLSSKKHDSCYQPFYPTWLLSAFALALGAKTLGCEELVDIGSGDGRISFCGSLLGMKSYGIEIDGDLAELQGNIAASTEAPYKTLEADATQFDYRGLGLSRPMFFISGLPEMGDMLANSVLTSILSDPRLRNKSAFNFMGSHVMKNMSKDHTAWGWGKTISDFGLRVYGAVTLPTYWTTEEPLDTAYVYATAG
jgi:hypothetical protein